MVTSSLCLPPRPAERNIPEPFPHFLFSGVSPVYKMKVSQVFQCSWVSACLESGTICAEQLSQLEGLPPYTPWKKHGYVGMAKTRMSMFTPKTKSTRWVSPVSDSCLCFSEGQRSWPSEGNPRFGRGSPERTTAPPERRRVSS